MNTIRCECGHQRPKNKKEPCPNCHRKSYWFNLYLLPEEAKGLKVGAIIILVVTLLVLTGLAVMYKILGDRITVESMKQFWTSMNWVLL